MRKVLAERTTSKLNTVHVTKGFGWVAREIDGYGRDIEDRCCLGPRIIETCSSRLVIELFFGKERDMPRSY